MTDQRSEPSPFPGADATDMAAEQIIPPEQTPMDDAAGGPQADESDDGADEIAQRGGDADVTASGAE